ncbi:MAG: sugar transferase [Marinilabiliaceae bacterium]|nr:sugar transferase [Marinilabiliaceae bacterium]
MVSTENLSSRGHFVKTLLTTATVTIAIVSYFLSIVLFHGKSYASLWNIINSDFLITSVFIAIYWIALDIWLNLNEVYRSRSYGYVIIYHVVENVIGVILLTFTIVIFGLPSLGRPLILTFGAFSTIVTAFLKIIFYVSLRHLRKKGYNSKTVVFICDRGGEGLLNLIHKRYEWGYKIKAIIGDPYILEHYDGAIDVPIYPISNNTIEELLVKGTDELIYARSYDSSQEILHFINICQDLGVTFRLYSPFLNRISTNTQLRYFDTNVVITITNTPTNYVGLLAKRLFDLLLSSCIILCGLPFFIIIALMIKLDSKGPIFFAQKRCGLRGRKFKVYKFRTMVENAEALKGSLMNQNEMDGPVFKIANDPRITRVGKLIRKSGIDEFPQFWNVFIGDMSIVGPRPPLPDEVEKYERWQLRRLSMQPGITCLWQIAPNRNSISFEEWMHMDMDYIDNWSFSLDMVIFIKTIRSIFRADGK